VTDLIPDDAGAEDAQSLPSAPLFNLPGTVAGAALTKLADEREAQFDERFSLTFPINSVPPTLDREALQETSKAALSNLLGSMRGTCRLIQGSAAARLKTLYATGRHPAWHRPDSCGVLEGCAAFTAVPSRSFFPRGFLWDEGFHQLLGSGAGTPSCNEMPLVIG